MNIKTPQGQDTEAEADQPFDSWGNTVDAIAQGDSANVFRLLNNHPDLLKHPSGEVFGTLYEKSINQIKHNKTISLLLAVGAMVAQYDRNNPNGDNLADYLKRDSFIPNGAKLWHEALQTATSKQSNLAELMSNVEQSHQALPKALYPQAISKFIAEIGKLTEIETDHDQLVQGLADTFRRGDDIDEFIRQTQKTSHIVNRFADVGSTIKAPTQSNSTRQLQKQRPDLIPSTDGNDLRIDINDNHQITVREVSSQNASKFKVLNTPYLNEINGRPGGKNAKDYSKLGFEGEVTVLAQGANCLIFKDKNNLMGYIQGFRRGDEALSTNLTGEKVSIKKEANQKAMVSATKQQKAQTRVTR